MRWLGWRWFRGATAAALALLALGASATTTGAAPFVYVTNQLSDDISQYAAGATGALTPLSPPTAPAPTFPQEGVALRAWMRVAQAHSC